MKKATIILCLFFLIISCKEKSSTTTKNELSVDKLEIIREWKKAKEKFINTPKEDFVDKVRKKAPQTLREGMERLKKEMKKEDLETFKMLGEGDAVSMHFGMGMGLRNSWGLWHNSKIAQYLYARGITHPDHMSGVIMTSFVNYVQGKEWELEIDKKYPEHFKIVDSILQGDNKLLEKLTEKLKKLPEHKDVPAALEIAGISCNSKAFSILNKFPGSPNARYQRCDSQFFNDIIKMNRDFLKNYAFVITSAQKPGVISKICKNLPSFSPEQNKNIFDTVLRAGNNEDFLCVKKKYKEVPEIKIHHFACKYLSKEKEIFLLDNMSHSLFKDRKMVGSILSNLADKPKERIKSFIKTSDIKADELGNEMFIHWSMNRRDTDVLDILFENGFSHHYILKDDRYTLLDLAIKHKNPIAIDYLLEKGADPNYRMEDWRFPIDDLLRDIFHFSNPVSSDIIIKYLVAVKGMSIKGKNRDAISIDLLLSKADLNLLKFFRNNGYDLSYDSSDELWVCPIFSSLDNKDKQVFDWLIKEIGYDINMVDKDGNTAIHQCVNEANIKKLRFMIDKGASTTIKNKTGLTPLDLAKNNVKEEKIRHKEYIERMKKYKMNPNNGFHKKKMKDLEEMIQLLSPNSRTDKS